MDSLHSTEPIAATSDSTPQQLRYAQLLSLSSQELNGMAVRLHRLGGHVRLRFAEVLLALNETGQYKDLGFTSIGGYSMLCFPPSVPPRGRRATTSSPPPSSTCASRGNSWACPPPPPPWSTESSPGPTSARSPGWPRRRPRPSGSISPRSAPTGP